MDLNVSFSDAVTRLSLLKTQHASLIIGYLRITLDVWTYRLNALSVIWNAIVFMSRCNETMAKTICKTLNFSSNPNACIYCSPRSNQKQFCVDLCNGLVVHIRYDIVWIIDNQVSRNIYLIGFKQVRCLFHITFCNMKWNILHMLLRQCCECTIFDMCAVCCFCAVLHSRFP